MKLELLYEDQFIVAIHKPSGLLVHKSEIARRETEFAMQILRDQIGKYVYPVHRLDRPTSGVLLFALDSDSARNLADQFKESSVEKEYLALVRGYLKEDQRIDYPLKYERDDYSKVQKSSQEKQDAITDLECLERFELNASIDKYPKSRFSLVKAKPLTGRKHQIRRHLRHLNHPIIGDTTHGSSKYNRYFRQNLLCDRLLLHCYKMNFKHPQSNEIISLCSEFHYDFKELLTKLRSSI